MRLLVTAGGTEEPLDSVRFLGNRSSGLLGALLAQEAVARGHEVLLLRAARAVAPRAELGPALQQRLFVSTADLKRLLQEDGAAFGPQVIIHGAAVADFLPEAVHQGKLSSKGELTLRLLPNEKLAPQLKAWCPGARLVVFKLEAGLAQDELFARARAGLGAAGADLVVANLAQALGNEEGHLAWILDAQRVRAEVRGKAAIAKALLDILEEP